MSSRTSPLAEVRSLLRLAAPLSAAHAGTHLMGLVDTAIVGRLGAAELGGVGIANGLFFFVSVFGMGAMLALNPLVSQALGAGQDLRARRLVWQGLWLALGLSLLLALPIALAPFLLEPIGIPPEVAGHARTYLWVRLPSILPVLAYVVLRSYLQAIGRPRPLLVAMAAANIFNLVATLYLVHGGAALPAWTGPLRALPPLGVFGAAIATDLCHVVIIGILAAAIRSLSPREGARIDRRPNPVELRRALRVGWPIGCQLAAEVGVFSLVGLLAGKLGTTDLAAHRIALNLASFTFTLAVGVGSAGTVRVGRAVGAGDARAVRRSGILAMATGAGLMGIAGVFLLAFPRTFAGLLTDDPAVLAVAGPLLLVAAVFQVFDGLQAVSAGALRGIGDTRFPFFANLAGHWLLGLPVGVGLGLWAGLGVTGLWWGLCVGLMGVGILLAARFLRLSVRPIRPLVPAEEAADAA